VGYDQNGYNRGTGSDSAPARTEISKEAISGEGLEETHQLVSRAESKLIGLHASRSQLRKRIRALHYLLKTLETRFSPFNSPDPGLYPAAQEPSFNQDGPFEFERNLEKAVTAGTSVRQSAISEPEPAEGSTDLRRACRIALMESDRPQGCEQILRRIRRRGSVCVEGFDDPVIAIARVLGEMLTDGEVIQKKDNQLWQLNRDSDTIADYNFARSAPTSTPRGRTQSG
jgi:hypothetical protein